MALEGGRRETEAKVTFGPGTNFNGLLKFRESLCIRGKFTGTIEAQGSLIVDRGAVVEADHISVSSLTVYGAVIGTIHAADKIDVMSGAEVRGDLTAMRLRIADEVLFEGRCSMIQTEKEVDIFSRPTEEIKAELQKTNG
ncbi:MAG: polymer-forming cytoskeletal protein [Spirochaetaceae bacterium]|jgi:cytoskeletal protein CcmA (bactofilin family)|nr:polymer-forming cytoskeletal protein [Spirochaetaceae bacterium]